MLRDGLPEWVRRPVLAALATLLTFVGLSRMYLGHHWLTDVTASYLLGSSYLWALTSFYERYRQAAVRRPKTAADIPTASAETSRRRTRS